MGIDIYAEWQGQTEAEHEAQVCTFSIAHGHVGYLREAYHGGPYVTMYLVSEAFETGAAEIAANVMRARLPCAVLMALHREYKLYGQDNPAKVTLEELPTALHKLVTVDMMSDEHVAFAALMTPRTWRTGEQLIALDRLPDFAKSFVDFVVLCERKERETGKPCRIIASA